MARLRPCGDVKFVLRTSEICLRHVKCASRRVGAALTAAGRMVWRLRAQGGRPRRPRGASSAPSGHLPQAGEGFWRGVRALGKEANCISLSRFASEPASSCQGEALRRGQDPALQDVCEGMIEKATGTDGFCRCACLGDHLISGSVLLPGLIFW